MANNQSTKESTQSVSTTSTGSLVQPAQKGVLKQTVTEIMSGPIPDPQTFLNYKKVDESFPERIMKMAEQEQRHVQEINVGELKCKQQELQDVHRGQILGFVGIIILASCGLCAILLHETTVACTIFGTTILGVFGARIFTKDRK